MLRLLESLSDYDKTAISKYIGGYGRVELPDDDDFATLWRVFLNDWAESKSFLFNNVFDGKLRMRFPIHVEMAVGEINMKLKKIYSVPFISEFGDTGIREYLQCHLGDDGFVNHVLSYIEEMRIQNLHTVKLGGKGYILLAKAFTQLIKYHNVRQNRVESPVTYNYVDSRDNCIHQAIVPVEAKTMRAIRTFLTNIGFPYMEEFDKWRESVSVVTTVKDMDVDLVLSIHPIDFMTMSDNNCDWRSCMHWSGGEFSNGTVEMMNGPYVVVGYIEDRKNPTMNRFGYDMPNKSWRCLFYINDSIVLSGKPYPFNNPQVEKKGVEILKELAEKAFGHKYLDVQRYTDMEWYYDNYDGYDMDRSSTIMSVSESDSEWQFPFEPDEDDDEFSYGELVEQEVDGKVLCATGEFMYNDLYEDCGREYFCAKSSRLHGLTTIDFGGTCRCLSCGDNLTTDDVDDNNGEKYCYHCKERYECEDGILRPHDHLFQVELENGDEVKMTEEMMRDQLWWRPYTESFVLKENTYNKDYSAIVFETEQIPQRLSDAMYQCKIYLQQEYIDSCIKVAEELNIRSIRADRYIAGIIASNSYCVWNQAYGRYNRFFFVDDMDAFIEETKKFATVEEVNIEDEIQSSHAFPIHE